MHQAGRGTAIAIATAASFSSPALRVIQILQRTATVGVRFIVTPRELVAVLHFILAITILAITISRGSSSRSSNESPLDLVRQVRLLLDHIVHLLDQLGM
jgi:hypothetical protein